MSTAKVLLIVAGLLAVAQCYQETQIEDVVEEYELQMFKNLFLNTTKQVLQALTRLETNAAKESSLSALEESIQEIQDGMRNLSQNSEAARETVEDGTDGTKVELRMFQDRVLAQLQDLKTTVDQKTRRMEEQISQLNQASVNALAGDCQDLHDQGFNASGAYYLQKFGRRVLCDMESGSGIGWLVVQRRTKVMMQVDFNRDWHEYKAGFGDLETEFWAGNDFLHVITNQKNYKLRVDMTDYEKGNFWASYNTFRVGSEEAGYPLDLGNYTGNATDAFTYHHGRQFTSTDRDHDLYDDGNCATFFSGAWWYERCYDAHLNGVYPVQPDRQNSSFITWWAHEDGRKVPLVLTEVTLKVTPTTH